MERLAGDSSPRPEEAHERRAARLGLQRRHGREGAGDVDAVQHQRDEAAAATEEALAFSIPHLRLRRILRAAGDDSVERIHLRRRAPCTEPPPASALSSGMGRMLKC